MSVENYFMNQLQSDYLSTLCIQTTAVFQTIGAINIGGIGTLIH